MTVTIELSEERVAELKAKAAVLGLTLEDWLQPAWDSFLPNNRIESSKNRIGTSRKGSHDSKSTVSRRSESRECFSHATNNKASGIRSEASPSQAGTNLKNWLGCGVRQKLP
jgi:hypothetical protein